MVDRLTVVKAYINRQGSLRKLADRYRVSYQTIHRWIKWYQSGGEENLIRIRRPWNRPTPEDEETIMLLKEKTPGLSLKEAQKILKSKGINKSLKGIWSVWNRYGLTRCSRKNPFNFLIPANRQTTLLTEKIRFLQEKGDLKKAADIINSIPALTDASVLENIPEGLLSIRRLLDYYSFFFGRIEFADYLEKLRYIKKALRKKTLYYSLILTELNEINLLQWISRPRQELRLLLRLKDRVEKIRNPAIRFRYYLHLGMTYAILLKVDECRECIKRCKRFTQYPSLKDNYKILASIGDLMTAVGDYQSAISYFSRALKSADLPVDQERIYLKLSITLITAGDYQRSWRFLKKVKLLKEQKGYQSMAALIKAQNSFALGEFEDASRYFQQSLQRAETSQIHLYISSATVGLAMISMALGNVKEAGSLLRSLLPMLQRYDLIKRLNLVKYLLKKPGRITGGPKAGPALRLMDYLWKAVSTLRFTDYKRVYSFAKKHRLLGYLQRMLIFYPEVVTAMLEAGRRITLPGRILRYPIFNKKGVALFIRFLGPTTIYKDGKHLKTNLTPKEQSFLIQLAVRAGAPNRNIPLDDLYRNFWPAAKNPSKNLTQLLFQIRKKLKLSAHLLTTKRTMVVHSLINKGIYFSTDFQQYQETITMARSFERANRWTDARNRYLHAFRLLRGRFLRGMYDQWSEELYTRLSFIFDQDLNYFIDTASSKGETALARKFTQKLEKMVKSQ